MSSCPEGIKTFSLLNKVEEQQLQLQAGDAFDSFLLLHCKLGRRLTQLLDEVTVVDAFLRAEGGQLEPGWLLLFLRSLLRR